MAANRYFHPQLTV